MHFCTARVRAQVLRCCDGWGREPQNRVIQSRCVTTESFGDAWAGALDDGAVFAGGAAAYHFRGEQLISPACRDDRREPPPVTGVDELNWRRRTRGRYSVGAEYENRMQIATPRKGTGPGFRAVAGRS